MTHSYIFTLNPSVLLELTAVEIWYLYMWHDLFLRNRGSGLEWEVRHDLFLYDICTCDMTYSWEVWHDLLLTSHSGPERALWAHIARSRWYAMFVPVTWLIPKFSLKTRTWFSRSSLLAAGDMHIRMCNMTHILKLILNPSHSYFYEPTADETFCSHVWHDILLNPHPKPERACSYGVAMISRLLQIIGIFCRI